MGAADFEKGAMINLLLFFLAAASLLTVDSTTVYDGNLAPGTYSFPGVAIPQGKTIVSIRVDRGTFVDPSQVYSFNLIFSGDGGATWQRATKDPRIEGSWYFSRVFVDPNHPQVVYVMQTCTYRSNDGGKTFFAFRGAPSGEDCEVPAHGD